MPRSRALASSFSRFRRILDKGQQKRAKHNRAWKPSAKASAEFLYNLTDVLRLSPPVPFFPVSKDSELLLRPEQD